jgi:tRNA pseudouridine32 synthase/23S rRNA pseudouridine746 synthase
MNALGLPILGDGIYPHLTPEGQTDTERPLQLLARSVAFTDPLTGLARRFDSPRRLDLQQACLNGCGPARSPS